MIRRLLLAIIAFAGAQTLPAAEVKLAVIDLRAVFEQYETFQTRERELRVWVEQREEERKRARLACEERARKDIFVCEFGERIKPVDREARDREARMYLTSLREVQATVREYAQEHDIQLVIRYQEPRDDFCGIHVDRFTNRNIVHFNQAIDITAAIVTRLNAAGDSSESRSP